MGMKQRELEGITVLELRGRLTTGESAEALDAELQRLAAENCRAVLLDCSLIGLVDSEGVRVLVRGLATFEKKRGVLNLLRPSPKMLQILDVTHLRNAVGTFHDESSAVQGMLTELAAKDSRMAGEPERRRDKRAPVNVLAQIEIMGKGGSILGRTANISTGGLLVLTQNTLQENTEVDIRMNLPPNPPGIPVEAKGMIVHEKKGESMGIQFLIVNKEEREAIERLVSESPDSF